MRKKNKSIYQKIVDVTSGVTSGITSHLIGETLPDNAWVVLSQFCCRRNFEGKIRGFMICELRTTLSKVMHINTLRDMLKRLEKKGYIRCYNEFGGRNARNYCYIVTIEGVNIWKKYEEEMKQNIGKLNISGDR